MDKQTKADLSKEEQHTRMLRSIILRARLINNDTIGSESMIGRVKRLIDLHMGYRVSINNMDKNIRDYLTEMTWSSPNKSRHLHLSFDKEFSKKSVDWL